jgi:hypothetical protein
MVTTQEGLLYGWNLYRLARDTGRTPWEAAHDPHLAFNATAQRAHDTMRRRIRDLAFQRVEHGDDLGIARILTTLQLLLEE